MRNKKPKVVSIYSGGGGIDIGFYKAGYDIIYATDNWNIACDTLIENRLTRKVECKDIRKIKFKVLKKELGLEDLDCLIGGPPCPPFSKSRFYLIKKKRALEDDNAYTLVEYFRAVKELNPKVYFFENVHGFIYKPHLGAFNYLKTKSRELGYKIYPKVINAAFFGIPQTRERFFCIGVRKDLSNFSFPKETHYNPNGLKGSEYLLFPEKLGKKPWITCKEAIGDLDIDLPEDKDRQAGSRHKNLLKKIPPGDNYLFFTAKRGYPNPKFKWRSRYWSFLLKLSLDRPSWTIQASHSNNMGPFHWKNRYLRISELKRIQTFDDDDVFKGDYKAQRRQIGNAVPPLLANILAESIKDQLLSIKKS